MKVHAGIFFASLLLFIPNTVFSQKKFEIKNTREIVVNYRDSVVHATISMDPENVKASADLDYYWSKSNVIFNNRGGYGGNLLHGIYMVYDKSDRLMTEGNFKMGLKHGAWKSWYPNGKLKVFQNWENGKIHGLSFTYDIQGNVTSKFLYKNGILQGKSYRYSNDSTEVILYKNGKPVPKQQSPVIQKEEIKEQKEVPDNSTQIPDSKQNEKRAKRMGKKKKAGELGESKNQQQ